MKGKGKVHLADNGFVNSKWATCYINANDKNQLVITWFFMVNPFINKFLFH